MNISEMFGLNSSSLNSAREFYAGVECEIESVKEQEEFEGFMCTEDGSLRNHGVEYISVPLQKDKLLDCFSNLHANLEFYNPEEAFSSRTSTHVHINCRALQPEQTKTLVLLYALYEEFFFAMVEQDRRGNIHCVPLTETHLPGNYAMPIEKLCGRWHKYTALNILPLQKLGTVEFRHLQGTSDVVLFGEWLQVLENLWKLSQETTITVEALTSKEVLKLWWKELFGHSKRIMVLEPSFNNIIANSLLDVKFSFI